MLTETDVTRAASATGFQTEPLEKVIRLLEMLDGLWSHPFLKPHLALKGGTALNLFAAELPRLSVDIDLDYVGTADRETMLGDRPKMEQAVQAVCGRLDIQVKRSPTDHAGGKWRLSFTSVHGRTSTLELDVNFILRTPLWPLITRNSRTLGPYRATQIRLLDIHELAAGKITALMARSFPRDIFDVRLIMDMPDLDHAKLRLAFVVYGGMNRRDWREVAVEDVRADPDEIDRGLLPMLRADLVPSKDGVSAWTHQLVDDCRDRLSTVLPLAPNEVEFLDRLNDRGDIIPEILTVDPDMQAIIRDHPGLRWKALNVKKHFGIAETGEG
jgi:predicted nucleotidyltransferase component of viral defense system